MAMVKRNRGKVYIFSIAGQETDYEKIKSVELKYYS